MHSSYFVLKNKEGKQAEQIVKDYLTGRGYTVQDVSEEQDNYQNDIRFLYKGIIIKHNKTEPTYTKTSLFLCEKRRFFMARTEKGGKVFLVSQAGRSGFFHFKTRRIANGR